MTFAPWPKIPRLRRATIVTEKIDGTNSCIFITDEPDTEPLAEVAIAPDDESLELVPAYLYAQSRKRLISPDDDNHGFATWVHTHADVLAQQLSFGRHFGEWWGLGIQRGYDMVERRFSLFNVKRWDELILLERGLADIGVHVVPTLLELDVFDTAAIEEQVQWLRDNGSVAGFGYKDPEGVVVRHMDSGQMFKRLLVNDDIPKSAFENTGELVLS